MRLARHRRLAARRDSRHRHQSPHTESAVPQRNRHEAPRNRPPTAALRRAAPAGCPPSACGTRLGWGVLEDQRRRRRGRCGSGSTGTTGRSGNARGSGIGYYSLDNGFRSYADPEALQRICDRLGRGAVKSFFWGAAAAALTADVGGPARRLRLRAGVSPVRDLDTRVFDRPAAGRSFFEQLIGDDLDNDSTGAPPVHLISTTLSRSIWRLRCR